MNRPRRPDGVDPVLRSRARRRALQAIYAWQISGGSAQQVIAQFAHEQAREQADLSYFEDLVRGAERERRVWLRRFASRSFNQHAEFLGAEQFHRAPGSRCC